MQVYSIIDTNGFELKTKNEDTIASVCYCLAEHSPEMFQRVYGKSGFPLSANHIVDVSCYCRLRLYFSMWLIVWDTFFHTTQHLNTSSEKSDETERLKQLMSENSSLKQKTFELQNQLQGLLEKLKNDKEKVRKFQCLY